MPLLRQIAILAGCLACLALLGWVDYVTGYEFGFFVFYSGPVGVAAWQLGRWPGILISLAATLTWGFADALTGQKYSSVFYLYWNNIVHFTCFVINAVAIAKIKGDLDRIHRLSDELKATRSVLRSVASRLPACPVCGKAHPPVPSASQPVVLPPGTESQPEPAAVLCEGCRLLPPGAAVEK
ncbi:MAG: hypothetical protein WCO56_04000 [Verrucomicrobiota bacterium]